MRHFITVKITIHSWHVTPQTDHLYRFSYPFSQFQALPGFLKEVLASLHIHGLPSSDISLYMYGQPTSPIVSDTNQWSFATAGDNVREIGKFLVSPKAVKFDVSISSTKVSHDSWVTSLLTHKEGQGSPSLFVYWITRKLPRSFWHVVYWILLTRTWGKVSDLPLDPCSSRGYAVWAQTIVLATSSALSHQFSYTATPGSRRDPDPCRRYDGWRLQWKMYSGPVELCKSDDSKQ